MYENEMPCKWKVLMLSYHTDDSDGKEKKLLSLKNKLEENNNLEVLRVYKIKDLLNLINSTQDATAILMEIQDDKLEEFNDGLNEIRSTNKKIPVVAFSEMRTIDEFNPNEFEELTDFFFLYADTVNFLAGKLMEHSIEYAKEVISPFLSKLIKYSHEYKYAWHTPGHMGGVAFMKSPPGKFFFDFLGENVFRADLSISVPELGSLLDHEGPIGDSEREAARVFGSDQTYYVLNGTSSVNQIIWRGTVTAGNLALVDRNCHKSLNYGMVVSEAIPSYLIPRRNALGIIGPVRLEEFTEEYIRKTIEKNPKIQQDKKNENVKMIALTNSTYDGVCYNVNKIMDNIDQSIENIHFDEAWYSYAKFHPLYSGFFGMNKDIDKRKHVPIFASQSTHKLLAALSQSSMLHVKNGTDVNVDSEIFNEAYMMYGSTSPQYNMIASLDVATNMMKFNGEELINSCIEDAIDLRKALIKIYNKEKSLGSWFFNLWQPEKVMYDGKKTAFEDVPTEFLARDQKTWIFDKNDNWHGFSDIEDDFAMLDPIKLTIKMPGIDVNGNYENFGIPASIVSDYLINFGIVVEKTDYYSFLLLNSIATTKSKQGELLIGLSHFKDLYEENTLLETVFPDLVEKFPERYKGVGLKDHCQSMHEYIIKNKMLELMQNAFEVIPNPKYTPAEAARKVFRREVEKVTLDQVMGKVAAAMVVPYPPGIPILMGGEEINENSKSIIEYLLVREAFEREFPGYYGDIHGIEAIEKDGKRVFSTMVLK